MRVSRIFIFAIFTLMLGGIAIYAAAQTDFDQLKSLEGNWVGKTSTGENANVTYTLTAGGSAVMEKSQGPHGEDMITMYYQNNGKIMMTHYCMLNNQPRMESAGGSTPNQIAFNFVDGTNMADAKATHMHKLVFTFKDKDHFSQEWTLLDKGQEKPMVFEFERAK